MSMTNSNEFQVCSAVPQQTAPSLAPFLYMYLCIYLFIHIEREREKEGVRGGG
jgi:hypothetical protein